MSSAETFQSLANDIATGFDALLQRLDAQAEVEKDLRQKLYKAIRANSSTSDQPSDGALSSWQDEIVKQISGPPAYTDCLSNAVAISPSIARAQVAITELKANANMTASVPTRKCPVPHKPQPAATTTTSTPRRCPVAHVKPPPKYQEMEKDFTTQGKPSSLECPFATMTKNGLPAGLDDKDPIAAEFHADVLSAQSLDEARSCGRCPIRFLDKHSPEELAEYFEKHKHELPRSHEICVKRYQQNEVSIRQLDAKYGSLVNMIQGLGNKHKPFLPNEQQNIDEADARSGAAVEKWAQTVDEDGLESEVGEVEAEVDEQRQSHFNKPLREVRVGESPSRPWGIHVPKDRAQAASASSADVGSAISPKKRDLQPSQPVESDPQPAIETAKTDAAVISEQASTHGSSRRSRKTRLNQVIFNGPVFIGYAPEQAAAFLSQLQNLGLQTDTAGGRK